MRRPVLLTLLLLLAASLTACTRPLTPGETAFARDMFGPSLDPARVHVRVGAGVTPLPRPKPTPPAQGRRADIPAGFCTRTPQPRQIRWPAAFVLGNTVFIKREYYTADTFPNWPESFLVPQGFLMAHELTHVWQWQNRATTHYSPLRPLAEATRKADPYFWDQTGPRLQELHAILAPVLPLALPTHN